MMKVFEKIGKGIHSIRRDIHNAKMHAAWKAVEEPLHYGMKRIMLGGTWIDKDNNLYNVTGKCVGKIIWNEKAH